MKDTMTETHDSKAAGAVMIEILQELENAQTKFPGKNVTFAALIEEIGETATALFSEPRENVRKEAVQVAVVAMRLILEGDHTFDAWRKNNGLDPLMAPAADIEKPARRVTRGQIIGAMRFSQEPYKPGERETMAEIPKPARVTPAMVDAEIMDEKYHVFPDSAHTVCILTLRNGFTVTGESACADKSGFDADLGRDLAKGDARQKAFAFLAFRLSDELHRAHLRELAKPLMGTRKEAEDTLIRSVMQKVAE